MKFAVTRSLYQNQRLQLQAIGMANEVDAFRKNSDAHYAAEEKGIPYKDAKALYGLVRNPLRDPVQRKKSAIGRVSGFSIAAAGGVTAALAGDSKPLFAMGALYFVLGGTLFAKEVANHFYDGSRLMASRNTKLAVEGLIHHIINPQYPTPMPLDHVIKNLNYIATESDYDVAARLEYEMSQLTELDLERTSFVLASVDFQKAINALSEESGVNRRLDMSTGIIKHLLHCDPNLYKSLLTSDVVATLSKVVPSNIMHELDAILITHRFFNEGVSLSESVQAYKDTTNSWVNVVTICSRMIATSSDREMITKAAQFIDITQPGYPISLPYIPLSPELARIKLNQGQPISDADLIPPESGSFGFAEMDFNERAFVPLHDFIRDTENPAYRLDALKALENFLIKIGPEGIDYVGVFAAEPNIEKMVPAYLYTNGGLRKLHSTDDLETLLTLLRCYSLVDSEHHAGPFKGPRATDLVARDALKLAIERGDEEAIKAISLFLLHNHGSETGKNSGTEIFQTEIFKKEAAPYLTKLTLTLSKDETFATLLSNMFTDRVTEIYSNPGKFGIGSEEWVEAALKSLYQISKYNSELSAQSFLTILYLVPNMVKKTYLKRMVTREVKNIVRIMEVITGMLEKTDHGLSPTFVDNYSYLLGTLIANEEVPMPIRVYAIVSVKQLGHVEGIPSLEELIDHNVDPDALMNKLQVHLVKANEDFLALRARQAAGKDEEN